MKYLAIMTAVGTAQGWFRMDFTSDKRPTLEEVKYLEDLLHEQQGFPTSVKVIITNLIELGDD